MSLGRELLVDLVDAFERDPELARRFVTSVREAMASAAPPATPEILFERVASFAKRTGWGERTMWSFVGKGLPTVGAGKARRVDVVKGLEWLKRRSDPPDTDARATTAARRASMRLVPKS